MYIYIIGKHVNYVINKVNTEPMSEKKKESKSCANLSKSSVNL